MAKSNAASSGSFECPNCRARVRAVARPDREIKGRCPRCSAVFLIPRAGAALAVAKPADSSDNLVALEAVEPPAPARGGFGTALLWMLFALSIAGSMAGIWFIARMSQPRDGAGGDAALASNDSNGAADTSGGETGDDPSRTSSSDPNGQSRSTDNGRSDGATRGGKAERTPPPSTGRPGELGERYALLVGVREYDEEATGLRSLQFTEDDVESLAAVLKDAGYRPHNIIVMTQTRGVQKLRFLPERERILEQLRKLVEGRGAQDTVLVAFAGHGVQFKGSDDSHFCPLGTKLDDRGTLISYAEVFETLRASESGFSLLLSDACRNEALAPGARRATVDVESVTRPPTSESARGVAAFFGCAPGEVAFEDKSLRHGVFFHHVIQGLKGEADLFHDGEVSLDELVAYTRKHVPDYVQSKFESRQTPHLVGDVKGQLVLARVTVEERPAPPKPTEPDVKEPDTRVTTVDPPKAPVDPPVTPSEPPKTPVGPPVAPPPTSRPPVATDGSPSVGSESPGRTASAGLPPLPPVGPPGIPAPPRLTVAQLEAAMIERNKIPPGRYPAQVAVPQCYGKTIASARQALHAVGLGLEIATPVARDEDIVRSQPLTAGKTVPSGTVVKLGMIHGRVPNLVGMTYADAVKFIETEGFKLGSSLRLDNPLPITHQDPVAGTLKQRNSSITVSHMVKVPDFTGGDLATARQRLAEQGFTVKMETAFQPGDTVYQQFPRGDRLVAFGVPVKLTAGVPAPNLIGTYARAEALLIQMGINGRIANRITVATDDPAVGGLPPEVTEQSIAPGAIMPRNGFIGVSIRQYAFVQRTQ